MAADRIAYTLQRRALDMKMEVLGARHPDTIAVMVELGITRIAQGYYKEVEPLAIQILQVARQCFPPTLPNAIAAMYYIAGALRPFQGLWAAPY